MADEGFTPEEVRARLTGESPRLAKQRRAFRRIPSDPRCKLCAAPFGGLGGLIFKQAGYKQSLNPALCTKCITELRKCHMTGVEIPITLLFSDLRGSTAIGERMRPVDFHTFLDNFYQLASTSIAAHDGIVDKVVGDEVIGLFFGGIGGPHHAAAPVAAAIDLAERAAQANTTTSVSLPVGTAVHTGEAFVGATRLGTTDDDFTALGDVVNITQRLTSAAVAGEVIVSVAAAEAAGLATDHLERRTVEIRGRSPTLKRRKRQRAPRHRNEDLNLDSQGANPWPVARWAPRAPSDDVGGLTRRIRLESADPIPTVRTIMSVARLAVPLRCHSHREQEGDA